MAQDFEHPVAVLADGTRRLLVADYTGGPDGGRLFAITTTDNDNDAVLDTLDNCIGTANPNQQDSNSDGYGNICDPDLNNSGLVTVADFAILRSVLNQSAASSMTAAAADLNGSGTVTTADFAILRGKLNTAPGPSGWACAGTAPCP